MRRGLVRCGVLLGALAWSLSAQAQSYSYLGFRLLHGPSNPYVFYMDGRPPPSGLSASEVEQALVGAWTSWASVPCTSLAFRYGGRLVPGPTYMPGEDPYDGFNLNVIWLGLDDPRRNLYLKGQVAAAVPVAYGGVLHQCDIFMDGALPWSASPSGPTISRLDVQSVLVREVGRCLGLGYTREDPAVTVMTKPLGPGQVRRQLSQHDMGQLCTLYPARGDFGWGCLSSADCRPGLTCAQVEENGPAVGGRFCVSACTSSGSRECPAPYTCQPSDQVPGSYYACLPPTEGPVTWVGKACATDATVCANPQAICKQPITQFPAGNKLWQDGYCTLSCANDALCPTSAFCATVGTERLCLQSCRPGLGDCRGGYVCAPLAEGNACIPACVSDKDCGSSNYTCRTCDNLCLNLQQPTRTVGDYCSASSECGHGQVCLLTPGNSVGVCSQPCTLSALQCSCPSGTSCQPVGPGSKYMCVRDCTGPSACSQYLQCSPLALGGTGCMPRCRSIEDCPGGTTCSPDGTCVDWNSPPDAGSCVLCGGDGGSSPPRPDGGSVDAGDGPNGRSFVGCGCQGGASAPLLLAALGLWMLALRRSR